jgi:hypothetical protein
LFETYDKDCDDKIVMNEFSEMMSPFQKEYKVLLNCRIDKGAVLNLDIDKVPFFLNDLAAVYHGDPEADAECLHGVDRCGEAQE